MKRKEKVINPVTRHALEHEWMAYTEFWVPIVEDPLSIWLHDVILTINSQPKSCNDLCVSLQPSLSQMIGGFEDLIYVTFINSPSSNG